MQAAGGGGQEGPSPRSTLEGLAPAEAAARLRAQLGGRTYVCILGGTSFQDPNTEALVRATAKELDTRFTVGTVFVTGGMPGVQKAFAEACGDGSRVWNLLPVGEASGYSAGKDVHAGADLEQRMAIFGLVGDLYVTFEGGPGVSGEARAAVARGAKVVPLMRTGGASSGMFDFPPEALCRPETVGPEVWDLLVNKSASIADSASAAATLAASYAAQDPNSERAAAKDRRHPEWDAAELKRHAKRAKAELARAVEVPVPEGDGDEEDMAVDDAGGAVGDEALAPGSVIGSWVSANGECRIFEDHMTSRLSYEEEIGDGSRLHGWLVRSSDAQALCWESTLCVLEEDQRPWYGPSFGEEPESVGDIEVRLTGSDLITTRIRVEDEDSEWQPSVSFGRKPADVEVQVAEGSGVFVFGSAAGAR